MHAVVIDRIRDSAALIPKVAVALGVTAYDVRASLQVEGGGPAILAVLADPAAAESTAAALRSVGVEAVTRDVAATSAAIGDFAVRRFEFGPTGLSLDTRDGRTAEVPYASVDAIVLACAIISTEHTEVVRERKFSPGRSLLTGGLINTRTRDTTQRQTHVDSEEIAFVFAGGAEAYRLGEASLVFQGLGAAIQPSRTANFQYLLAQLRQRCTGAAIDERLRKRAQQAQLLGRVLSPDDHLELAVALVAAHLRSRRGAPYRAG
ncbi:MAG: hypothetical protein JNK45_13290 [Myxococcales bacterium]|jgi:hypothetical protein|nr:hypothetical protein [Myxococcales bacterium]